MSYAAVGASNDVVERALRALPPCYSQSLDDCLEEISARLPECNAINEAYDRDFDRMEAAVDARPYCEPAPATAADAFPVRTAAIALAAALGGLVLGAWVL